MLVNFFNQHINGAFAVASCLIGNLAILANNNEMRDSVHAVLFTYPVFLSWVKVIVESVKASFIKRNFFLLSL